jgi:hypothetical protein
LSHQIALHGDDSSDACRDNDYRILIAIPRPELHGDFKWLRSISRNDVLNLVCMKVGPNIGRPIGCIWRARLIVEANNEIAAVAVKERECTLDDLCHALWVGE